MVKLVKIIGEKTLTIDNDFEVDQCENGSIDNDLDAEDFFNEVKDHSLEQLNKLIRCGLHTFQLAVYSSLDPINGFLQSVQKI